jgi:hypothetical protein
MKKVLLIIAAFLAIGIACVFFVRAELKRMHETQEDSARRALFVQVEVMLDSYPQEQRRYPSALGELVITNWPDGSSPITLSIFQYRSDGASYTLTCELPRGEPISTKGPK